jgi:hypothetical protein
MAVGQDRRLDPVRLNAEVPVFPVRLGPLPLEGAAVDKIGRAVRFDNVLGTGYLFGRAEGIKVDTHVRMIPRLLLFQKPYPPGGKTTTE